MVAVLPEAGLEACLGAYSVVVDRTTSQTTALATTATLVPLQAEPTPAPHRQLPTTTTLKVANTAAVLRVTDNNMARVKPTAATAAHNNTLPSHSTVASNMAMARKLVSAVNQDMVGQHQVTGKDHHMGVHQVAMDNKLATEALLMVHKAVLMAALATMINISTTSMVVLLRMLTNMVVEASSILLLVSTRLATVALQVVTMHHSLVGSKLVVSWFAESCAIHGRRIHKTYGCDRVRPRCERQAMLGG